MKLNFPSALLLSFFVHSSSAQNQFGELPQIPDMIEIAYPTWCIDESENRIRDVETCADGTPNGRFSPIYFSKENTGGDPDKGGYPTNLDIIYPFEYAAPYYGQACGGSSYHCPETFDGSAINCKKCPKLKTDNDTGPFGPGHVPPHITVASIIKAYESGFGGDVNDWFLYELSACRILPNILFKLIREYYPREEDGTVYYPPPFSVAGGPYPLEFVNLTGESCERERAKHGEVICFEQHSGDISQFPEYIDVGHGGPHYCTKEGKEADVNDDWCPYIFFGPNRGKYRHPHIAFSSIQTYLANKVMPDKCGITWDDSNFPAKVDTTMAFPHMEGNFPDVIGGFEAPTQPTIEEGNFVWPGPLGTKRKPVVGNFPISKHIVEGFSPESESSAAMKAELKIYTSLVLASAAFLIF